jgi:sarcosine oxidase, subunit beta
VASVADGRGTCAACPVGTLRAVSAISVSPLRGGRVVIIGGGVVGLSIAYHLTERGYRNVTLVERRTLGSGTTSKGTGGIRQQFSSKINVMLSRRAVDYFAHFADRVGEPVHFRQHGYLFLLDSAEQLRTFEKNVEKQHAENVPVELLKPTEIPEVMPHVNLEGLVGASYCPTDGSSSTIEVAAAFARRVRTLGATVLEGTTATAIERDAHGAVLGVQTTKDRIEAEVVVNAAGPWATEVGQQVGVTLPITPHRRQAFGIVPLPWFADELPLTVDLGTGAYVHPGPGGGVIGGNDRETPAGFDETVDWGLTPALMSALTHRIPAMSEAEIRSGWAGLRDMTPDDHAILGPLEDVPGFWVAAGFSGHGFMHAPVVGELLSEWLLDGSPEIDLTALRLERFEKGKMVSETTVF